MPCSRLIDPPSHGRLISTTRPITSPEPTHEFTRRVHRRPSHGLHGIPRRPPRKPQSRRRRRISALPDARQHGSCHPRPMPLLWANLNPLSYFKLLSKVAQDCGTPGSTDLLPGINAQPPFSTNAACSHVPIFFNAVRLLPASALR